MAESAPSSPHLAIERIYLRYLSFESPQAPGVFGAEWKPQVQIEINTRVNRLSHSRFEVVLTLTLEEKPGEDTLLVVELQQVGIFRIEGMDDATTRRQVLGIACPNVLFPYARETADTLVVKGTFPPFTMAPVNFDALFAEAEKRRGAEQVGNALN